MSGTLDWVGIQGSNLVNMCSVLGLQKCMVRHLGVCPYGFKKAVSEWVHLKVLYFYILQHFTLTGGLGEIKRGIRG